MVSEFEELIDVKQFFLRKLSGWMVWYQRNIKIKWIHFGFSQKSRTQIKFSDSKITKKNVE